MDGCTDSLSVFFNVEALREFYAPNAFSPDRNGINDTFFIFGGKEVANIDLSVFSFWGEKIYDSTVVESSGLENGWDGTFRGQSVEPGVYVWLANIQFIDGFTETFSGEVTVIK